MRASLVSSPPLSLLIALSLLPGACRRSPEKHAPSERGAASASARDVLCLQQSDGCVWCVGRDAETTYAASEPARPWVCDPKEPDNCVEFCSALTPDCALQWVKGPGCVEYEEVQFFRKLFERETAGFPEVVFRGRAVDDARKGIEGAQVLVWVVWRNQTISIDSEVTGRDGSFKLQLRNGTWTYTMRISHPGHASEIVDRLVLDRTAAAAPHAYRLGPEHVIRGRVLEQASKAGVASATVAAVRSPEDSIDVARTTTGDDGSFALGGLDAKRYFLRPAKFGWRPPATRASAVAPAARVTINLARVSVIRGVVRRLDGEPEPGARITAEASGGTGPRLRYTGTSNADGRFAQDDFAPGTYYVWARHGDMLVYPPEKVDLAPGQEVELAMTLKHKAARVSGVVRARDGQRLPPDTRVELESHSPLGFPQMRAIGQVDADGRFVVTGVLPGRNELRVHDGGRTLSIVQGPRDVEVPIEPNAAVPLAEPLVVRPRGAE